MENVIAAVVGLLGVTAGALLQYWLSRRMAHESQHSEQVLRAYADYLLAVAGVVQSQRHKDNHGLREGLRLLTDAKMRIVVYGEPKVVTALAAFSRLGGALTTPEQRGAFTSIIQAMRGNDVSRGSAIAEADIMQVIFDSQEEPR
jgi:hypothetical protein